MKSKSVLLPLICNMYERSNEDFGCSLPQNQETRQMKGKEHTETELSWHKIIETVGNGDLMMTNRYFKWERWHIFLPFCATRQWFWSSKFESIKANPPYEWNCVHETQRNGFPFIRRERFHIFFEPKCSQIKASFGSVFEVYYLRLCK